MKKVYLLLSILLLPFSALIAQTNHWETAVYETDTWHYVVPTTEPDTNWRKVTFNDATWSTGPGGIGFGDGDDNTTIGTTRSVYMRIAFNITDTSKISMAMLNVDYDDAFVVYLNNVEIQRSNITSVGPPAWNTLADATHEALMYSGGNPDYFPLSSLQTHSIIRNGTNVLSVQVHNFTATSSDLSSRIWLSFGIRDNSSWFGPTPTWFSAPIDFTDSKLPIVVINTNNQSIVDNPKIMADMGIIYNGTGNRNYMTDPFNDFNGKIGIEYRGSSSQWNFQKKPYGFEVWDVNGNTIDASLLGMPAESDWVLVPGFSDKTLMRNEYTYWMWGQMGYYTPRGQPVEVMLDGVYIGVYFLGEQVKRDNNRVDIANLQQTDIYGDQLTGGYILKVDKATGSSSSYWNSVYPPANNSTGNPVSIIVHYPDDSTIVPQQFAYIHAYCDSFEIALNSANFTDPVSGYRHFADETTFVDYFLITEFNKNLDGYRSSCYFYKDINSNDRRFKMGPVWDYDLSYGNADFCNTWMTSGWAYQFNTVCPGDQWEVPFWWDRLMQDSAFAQDVRCRWEELKVVLFNPTVANAYIDSMALYLNESQQRNYQAWPIIGSYVWPNYYVASSYQGEVDTLKWWIQQRFNWMDVNLPGNPTLCNVTAVQSLENNPAALTIYPNPFNTEINLDLLLSSPEEIQIEILNLVGQQVQAETALYHNGGSQTMTIPIDPDLAPGIYFVSVRAGNSTWIQQISKAE